jgi:hypothetical protein
VRQALLRANIVASCAGKYRLVHSSHLVSTARVTIGWQQVDGDWAWRFNYSKRKVVSRALSLRHVVAPAGNSLHLPVVQSSTRRRQTQLIRMTHRRATTAFSQNSASDVFYKGLTISSTTVATTWQHTDNSHITASGCCCALRACSCWHRCSCLRATRTQINVREAVQLRMSCSSRPTTCASLWQHCAVYMQSLQRACRAALAHCPV